MLQSDLDKLKSLDPTLVPDGTTTKDFTDTNHILSVSNSASVDDQEILKHYREPQSTDATSDNDKEESNEPPGPPQRPARLVGLLQNCNLFEEEQVAAGLRSNLEKLSVLYVKTLDSWKEQAKIDRFFFCTEKIIDLTMQWTLVITDSEETTGFSPI